MSCPSCHTHSCCCHPPFSGLCDVFMVSLIETVMWLSVSARHLVLSCTQDSSCFGGMVARFTLTCNVCGAYLDFTYISLFGTLISCIRMTCHVYQNWVFRVVALMLVKSACKPYCCCSLLGVWTNLRIGVQGTITPEAPLTSSSLHYGLL